MSNFPYKTDYAKTGDATCRYCNELISKDELRLAKMGYFSFDGKIPYWFHFECFWKNHQPASVGEIEDFENLRYKDQKKIHDKIVGRLQVDKTTNTRKRTADNAFNDHDFAVDCVTSKSIACNLNDENYIEQNERFWELRDKLKEHLTKKDMIEILKTNKQEIPKRVGVEAILDQLADIMHFGALRPCPKCKDQGEKGQLMFGRGGYKCYGNFSKWAKCENLIKEPDRCETEIPDKLKGDYPFLNDYNSEVSTRIILSLPREVPSTSSTNEVENTESVPKWIKLKGGIDIDPDSGLVDVAQVYREGSLAFHVVLTKVEIQNNKNSYYKLQILESDSGDKYWVFRSWGRTGTERSGHLLGKPSDRDNAVREFNRIYTDKTGNEWKNKANFKKHPDKYYPIDIVQVKRLDVHSNIPSELHKSIQDLTVLIFDVDQMKKTILEFEIDVEKMPLGHLNKSQLEKAHSVLNEISELIKKGSNKIEKEMFIDASNRFYSFVPHNVGSKQPPLLDTVDKIKAKIQMLDSLMEIEFAYSMLKKETNEKVNPIDGHFKQLRVDIEPLDHESEEFKLIEEYVRNTHAETHKHYELEIQEVFKVTREGEEERYRPWEDLHNRMLLWHGSRVTNYVGILANGLKIAPPGRDAGYDMFGKGIYFADMISKSANYCCTSAMNSTGLVMLCEVALGDMEEYKYAHYVTKLPAGKHSVKGLGATYPNPEESVKRDGVEIPLGKPITERKLRSGLRYNEYVVYNEAQVKCQYLLKLNFKYLPIKNTNDDDVQSKLQ